MPVRKASIATKCRPQMPQPAATPAAASHAVRAKPHRRATAGNHRHRGDAGDKTKNRRENGQAQVVLFGDASKHMQHVVIVKGSSKSEV